MSATTSPRSSRPVPRPAATAEKARVRLLGDVDAGRQPRTSATVAQLIERYLEAIGVENSAFAHAVRTEWIGTNPCSKAVAPRAAKPKARPPPSASQAAASRAWKDPV